jgi:hypothetical protein
VVEEGIVVMIPEEVMAAGHAAGIGIGEARGV